MYVAVSDQALSLTAVRWKTPVCSAGAGAFSSEGAFLTGFLNRISLGGIST